MSLWQSAARCLAGGWAWQWVIYSWKICPCPGPAWLWYRYPSDSTYFCPRLYLPCDVCRLLAGRPANRESVLMWLMYLWRVPARPEWTLYHCLSTRCRCRWYAIRVRLHRPKPNCARDAATKLKPLCVLHRFSKNRFQLSSDWSSFICLLVVLSEWSLDLNACCNDIEKHLWNYLVFTSYILCHSVTMPPHMRSKWNTVRDAATKSMPMEVKHYKT